MIEISTLERTFKVLNRKPGLKGAFFRFVFQRLQICESSQ